MARLPKTQQKQALSLEEVALKTLREVCESDDAPAARASAARTLLQALGVLDGASDRISGGKRDLTTLSIGDLDAEIRKFSGR